MSRLFLSTISAIILTISMHLSTEMQARFVTKRLNNNGSIASSESVNLEVSEEFTGSGLVEAPIVEIRTRKFTFTGAIRCTQKCVITTEQPFDHTMFKQEGQGEFIFIVEEFKAQVNEEDFQWKKIEPMKFVPIKNQMPEMPFLKDEEISTEQKVTPSFVKSIKWDNVFVVVIVGGALLYGLYEQGVKQGKRIYNDGFRDGLNQHS